MATLEPWPGLSAYTASKCALQGLSEVLAAEAGPHGVRTILIDLGIFRTAFLSHTTKPSAGLGAAYLGGAVDKTVAFLDGLAGQQPGDPILAAERIIEVVEGSGIAAELGLNDKGFEAVLRVPLGTDAAEAAVAASSKLKADSHHLRRLATSTDFVGEDAEAASA